MPERARILARWAEVAETLSWNRHWDELYREDRSQGRWFVGGELNVAANCLDRHLPERGDAVAVLWEGEPGDSRVLRYRELHADVCAFAAALSSLGVRAGDRVALHLGWLPETVVGMLACARLGAVHSFLPISLPPASLADRLGELRPRLLVTQDGAWRHGVLLPLKARADAALATTGGVEHTVVVRRSGMDVAWYEGDRWYHDLLAGPRPPRGADHSLLLPQPPSPAVSSPTSPPQPVPADHPLLVHHLASRRDRPTGVVHGSGGFLVHAAAMHRYGLTVETGDVFWCAVDLAWLAGQSHGVYGPLVNGATAVMFEGMLDTPTHARTWEVIERHRVNALFTTPSVVRNLRHWEDGRPRDGQLDSLRLIVTAGEPIDPEDREWLAKEVSRGRASVSDGWGQTELGGVVAISPPPTDPSDLPDPGLDVVHPSGRPVVTGDVGELVLRHPWPGTFVGIEGDRTAGATSRYWRYRGPYRERNPIFYATGDMARREADAAIAVLGRIDPVVNVSGQLVSLAEIADLLTEHPFVVDAEVLQRPDPRTGQALVACVVLQPHLAPGDELARELRGYVHETLGGLARPSVVAFVEAFPSELPVLRRRRALALLSAAGDQAETFTISEAQLLAAAEVVGST